jgi:DNA-binding ferritin-like protein
MGAGASTPESLRRSPSPGPGSRTRAQEVDLELQRRLDSGTLSPQQERALLDRRAILDRLGGEEHNQVPRRLDSLFAGTGSEPQDAAAAAEADEPEAAEATVAVVDEEPEEPEQAKRVSEAERTRANELTSEGMGVLEAMEHEATLDWQSYQRTSAAEAAEAACMAVGEGRAVLEAILKAAKRMGCKISHASHQTNELQDDATQFLAARQQADEEPGAYDVPAPADRLGPLDEAREAFEYAQYRQKKYGAEAAPAVEEATERVRQIVGEAAERLRDCLRESRASVCRACVSERHVPNRAWCVRRCCKHGRGCRGEKCGPSGIHCFSVVSGCVRNHQP